MTAVRSTQTFAAGKESRRIVEGLNAVLANEYALFTKTLNYHWNMTGPRFHSLHTFLEGHYHELLAVMDDIAERVRILDDHPISTVHGMLERMEIKDGTDRTPSTEDMLRILLRDHTMIQGQLRELVGSAGLFAHDPGTQDLLTGTLQKHEKMGWMIKSHLI
jgi:starvation-inducible DNA-binding protein